MRFSSSLRPRLDSSSPLIKDLQKPLLDMEKKKKSKNRRDIDEEVEIEIENEDEIDIEAQQQEEEEKEEEKNRIRNHNNINNNNSTERESESINTSNNIKQFLTTSPLLLQDDESLSHRTLLRICSLLCIVLMTFLVAISSNTRETYY